MAAERILIAEGNELVASTLAEQLKLLGYDVASIARNGEEAVRACEQTRPDLVLLDMQLPDNDGAATASQIIERAQTPVVMMLTFGDTSSVLRADQSGALAYLVKPVNPEELPPAIDIALARHREFQQLRERVGDLQGTLDSRKLIERAKGILMKRLNITGTEAEERLQQRAKATNTPVQDIAQIIVDSDALLS